MRSIWLWRCAVIFLHWSVFGSVLLAFEWNPHWLDRASGVEKSAPMGIGHQRMFGPSIYKENVWMADKRRQNLILGVGINPSNGDQGLLADVDASWRFRVFAHPMVVLETKWALGRSVIEGKDHRYRRFGAGGGLNSLFKLGRSIFFNLDYSFFQGRYLEKLPEVVPSFSDIKTTEGLGEVFMGSAGATMDVFDSSPILLGVDYSSHLVPFEHANTSSGTVVKFPSVQDPLAENSITSDFVPSGFTEGSNSVFHALRHTVGGELVWTGSSTWLRALLRFEHNRASLSLYSFDGLWARFSSGFSLGRFRAELSGGNEWRYYKQGEETVQFLQVTSDVSYQLNSVFSVFGSVQKSYGDLKSRHVITNWNFAYGGLRLDLFGRQNREEASESLIAGAKIKKPLAPFRPRKTGKGWLFQLKTKETERVDLIGTFNNWNPQVCNMKQIGEDRIWTLYVYLEPGIYEYTFLVDEVRIVRPPDAPQYMEDGFGNENGVLIVR